VRGRRSSCISWEWLLNAGYAFRQTNMPWDIGLWAHLGSKNNKSLKLLISTTPKNFAPIRAENIKKAGSV
jgi:hypothetical protein